MNLCHKYAYDVLQNILSEIVLLLKIKLDNELAWNPVALVCKPTKKTDQWNSSLVSQPDQL